jgi:ABC-type transporter Mla subunit MlaD
VVNPISLPADVVQALIELPGRLARAIEVGERLDGRGEALVEAAERAEKFADRLVEGGDKLVIAADRSEATADKLLASAEKLVQAAASAQDEARALRDQGGPILESSNSARDQLEKATAELARANEQVARIIEMSGPLERVVNRLRRD